VVERNLGAISKSLLNLGVPFPRVRLPETFIERPDALKSVKEKLLVEDDRTLVVSAIAGLGGLGKSVLAMALVLDAEVQARFTDGILWVTLGQNPNLQTMLGDWIRELDKSRESYSVTSLKSASQYLESLLEERQMLLVVDDAWNAAHIEWFRVGGASCRMLVTTRTAFIPGAERYSLDLMSPEESVALMRGELGKQWIAAMEKPAREFAKLLGYLPLALKLMAVQVVRGRKWEMLKKAFLREAERLRSLDHPGVKLEKLSEDERRDYSLRSCFGLSLQWLEPELLERFVWLGLLPEDAIIQQKMAMTLWKVEDWEAEAALLSLYESSLLIAGLETLEGEATYQIHDLLHLIAQELIEHPKNNESTQNSRSKIQNLPGLGVTLTEAHQQFLESYRERATDRRWDGLPNDGYIHRYLLWHMERVNWVDEIHELMVMSDRQGRNAWFEACERHGETASYISSIHQAWELADQAAVETFNPVLISLQCRYALIAASLNSLAAIPGALIVLLVQKGCWTPLQGLAYAHQIIDPQKRAKNIALLAEELPISMREKALYDSLEAVQAIKDEYSKFRALKDLANKLPLGLIPKALATAQSIKDEDYQVRALEILIDKLPLELLPKVLEAAKDIRDEYYQSSLLIVLAGKVPIELLPKILEVVKGIGDEYQSSLLIVLADKLPPELLLKALESAQSIQGESFRTSALVALMTRLPPEYFSQAQEIARAIENEDCRSKLLAVLKHKDPTLLDVKRRQAAIADTLPECLLNALKAAHAIEDQEHRDRALTAIRIKAQAILRNKRELTALENGLLKSSATQDLESVQAVQDELSQVSVSSIEIEESTELLLQTLRSARAIQDESAQINAKIALVG
jgi:hypothetical protein